MLERFEIRQGERAVGWARVVKQGLYYHFSCRCRLTGEVMHRISVRCGDREEDLGVCVPMDGQFGLEKRVPCKRFPDGKMEFFFHRIMKKWKESSSRSTRRSRLCTWPASRMPSCARRPDRLGSSFANKGLASLRTGAHAGVAVLLSAGRSASELSSAPAGENLKCCRNGCAMRLGG